MSSCGSLVEFPPFEGKFQRFQTFKSEDVQRLPNKPSIHKVFFIYGVSNISVSCKDGWSWAKGNKSNKTNFSNESGCTSALKYKCKILNCEAIRFIDTIFSHGVSRVYYQNDHRHLPSVSETKIPKDAELEVTSSKECIPKAASLKEIIFDNKKCSTPSSEEDDPFTPSHQKLKRKKMTTILLSDDDEPLSSKRLRVAPDHVVSSRKNDHKQNSLAELSDSYEKSAKEYECLVDEVKKITNATIELKLKYRVKKVELQYLIKQKERINTALVLCDDKKSVLNKEIADIERSLFEKRSNLDGMKTKKNNLEQEVKDLDEKNQIEEIDRQCRLLQSLLEENQTVLSSDHDSVKKSLDILSGRKHMKTQEVSSKEKNVIKRKLFDNSDGLEDSPAGVEESIKVPHQAESGGRGSEVGTISVPRTQTQAGANIVAENRKVAQQTGKKEAKSWKRDDFSNKDETVCKLSSEQEPVEEKRKVSDGLEDSPAGVEESIKVPQQAESGGRGSEVGTISVPRTQTQAGAKIVAENRKVAELTKKKEAKSWERDDCSNKDETVHIKVAEICTDEFSSQSSKRDENQGLDLEHVDNLPDVSINDEFEDICSSLLGPKRIFTANSGYKITESFWEEFEPTFGQVPHGFSGSGIFEIGLINQSEKVTLIEEIKDGRPWKKKSLVKDNFPECDNHRRYYQDCGGSYRCPEGNCSAKELFGSASQNFKKANDNLRKKKLRLCTSCDAVMELVQCCDLSLKDENGNSPPCRRILDFDYCHDKLTVRYAGEHSCSIGLKIKPMDGEEVKKFFRNHPSNTPAMFKDYIIAEAINSGADVEEVALQYADINKIRNIQSSVRRENDPDGSGFNYLERLGLALRSSLTIEDPYLLEIFKEPKLMIMLSSNERMALAKHISTPKLSTSESVSIDFCESQIRNFSVMAVTTYSRDLRQLVPLFQFIFQKPGESADNVELALQKIDEKMFEKYGFHFNPQQWTSDNSGAIENGIIRVKGEEVKSVLGSDKLHDENNINRVVKTLPCEEQPAIRQEIRAMINGLSSAVSENIYQSLIQKSMDCGYDRLLRSLSFNYRKRIKFWKSYREVEDNNCTTEQVNRLQTRHCKNASLMDGVGKIVRGSIADKAKFKLAQAGSNVNKGPTAKDRKTRVEHAGNKVIIQVVDSLEEMVSLDSQDSKSRSDVSLKKKALDDFKSKNSDTHRADKKRNLRPAKSVKDKIYNQKNLNKAKNKLKHEKLEVIAKEDSPTDIIITVKNQLGELNYVSFSIGVPVTCTCPDHSQSFYCVEILFLFKELKMTDLSSIKDCGEDQFKQIRTKLGSLGNTTKSLNSLEINRAKRKEKCSRCNRIVEGKQLYCKVLKQKFCVSRLCILKIYRRDPAVVTVTLSEDEKLSLLQNGIKIQ